MKGKLWTIECLMINKLFFPNQCILVKRNCLKVHDKNRFKNSWWCQKNQMLYGGWLDKKLRPKTCFLICGIR